MIPKIFKLFSGVRIHTRIKSVRIYVQPIKHSEILQCNSSLQKLTTALCTRRSSSLLLSQLMALNFSFITKGSNISHNAHVRDTHSFIKNHERMYYNLPLTATIHDSPNTKQHKCKKREFFTGDYRFKLATILAKQY